MAFLKRLFSTSTKTKAPITVSPSTQVKTRTMATAQVANAPVAKNLDELAASDLKNEPSITGPAAAAAGSLKSESFFQAAETRRSHYALSNKATIPDSAIQAIVERAVKFAPTSYNVQEIRAVLLTGDKHIALWDLIATEVANSPLPDGLKAHVGGSIENSFKKGYGTVVFLEDHDTLEAFLEKQPMLRGIYDQFSNNSQGMAQFMVWSALAVEGMGASLQHLGGVVPGVQEKISAQLGVPASWKSNAIMPFGVPAGPPGRPDSPKTFEPIENRVKVHFGSSA